MNVSDSRARVNEGEEEVIGEVEYPVELTERDILTVKRNMPWKSVFLSAFLTLLFVVTFSLTYHSEEKILKLLQNGVIPDTDLFKPLRSFFFNASNILV